MLSRRHLRIKVLQACYSFFQSHNDDLELGEKQLTRSMDKLYELYIYQLSFLLEILNLATNRIEEARHKYFPTPEDLNPNKRFLENRVLLQLASNKDYQRKEKALKVSWADEKNMVLKIYNEIKAGPDYDQYMRDPRDSYKNDREFLIKMVLNHIAGYDLLRQYYEDKSIFWSDEDFDTSIILLIKTLKGFQENSNEEEPLPSLYKADNEQPNEDKQFMLKLFHHTILHSDEYARMIEEQARNWELDRIAVMDILIMKMALSEILNFPSIPIKVSMNEYIEISKHYSSDKSKIFINGILDKLILKLKDEGEIKKVGRGLVE
jgi:N utilization substance protein B